MSAPDLPLLPPGPEPPHTSPHGTHIPWHRESLVTLQFQTLIHSALTEHLLYAWPWAGCWVHRNKESMVLALKIVTTQGDLGFKKIENYGRRGSLAQPGEVRKAPWEGDF